MAAETSTAVEKKWLVLATVMLGSIMGPIDASVVNVVLPTIAEFFRTGMSTAQWVPMIYLLMISSLLLTYGRLGDIYGYRAVYLSGLGGFVVSSAICGLSGSIEMLIAARALQGITAGMMMAVAHAIVVDVFPPYERGRALGINATSIAVGLAIGPTLGGFIAAYLGWRFIFLINIPIGVAALALAAKMLPRPPDGEERAARQEIDLIGAGTAFVSLFSFLFIVNRWQTMNTGMRISFLFLFFIALSLFIYTERRVPHPMLDLGIFRIRTFTFANLSAMLNFMSQYVLVFLTPFYLQRALRYAPDQIGLVMVAFPLVVLMVAPFSGALSDKIGTRVLSALGAGHLCRRPGLDGAYRHHAGFWRAMVPRVIRTGHRVVPVTKQQCGDGEHPEEVPGCGFGDPGDGAKRRNGARYRHRRRSGGVSAAHLCPHGR